MNLARPKINIAGHYQKHEKPTRKYSRRKILTSNIRLRKYTYLLSHDEEGLKCDKQAFNYLKIYAEDSSRKHHIYPPELTRA
jgi:hypothetical protein